ncbi:MAG: sigma-70 family RNA polymerase sigma factor [Acidobacteria bacterium]|nr:sigma-70 family RNA polymerase sigma factor [Acidobacteriota bacterium]MBI3422981.1 sigma-70 family RNA polymerase sigma factor [Acidobacteriota bacterium]
MSEQHSRASEQCLIAACQTGDREAFRQLFEAYQERVWAIAIHYTGEEQAARDITQQVFLKLFAALNQFRHEANFTTWLYRLVANVCLDEQRKQRRFLSFDFWRRADDDEELNPADWQQARQFQDGLQEQRCTQVEMAAAVRAAIKELSPPLRIAILLKYFEDMSYEEMARALDCSPGTVASRLNRGHKALAARLAHLRQ